MKAVAMGSPQQVGAPQPGVEAEVAHRGNPQVAKMKRCALCKREEESIGRYCARCDDLVSDIMADLSAEVRAR